MSTVSVDELDDVVSGVITCWKAQYKSYVFHQMALQGERPRKSFGGHHRYGPETWHERVWADWHPHMKRQVTFGTGKLGARMYLANAFTVDFLDEAGGVVWELDGATHQLPMQRTADLNKRRFLQDRGLIVERISAVAIEKFVEDSLCCAILCPRIAQVTPTRTYILEAEQADALRAAFRLYIKSCFDRPQFRDELRLSWTSTPPPRQASAIM